MIHVLAASYPPTGPYPPPTPALVTISEWAIPIILGVCLLIRFGAGQERKRQQREGRRRP